MPTTMRQNSVDAARIERFDERQLRVYLSGHWRLHNSFSREFLHNALMELAEVDHLSFDSKALEEWDSDLLIFLLALTEKARAQNIELDLGGLPPGVQCLLGLAHAAPSRPEGGQPSTPHNALQHGLTAILETGRDGLQTLAFIGETTLALLRVLAGRAKFNFEDLWPLVQECGPKALPIVTLVSFLVGTILAYMGAVQLQQFGAQIYIADLVALSVVREMGAIMTGIAVAGRSGAAFAAQLGTMKVNEEIDALETLGLPPIDYLVLPRMFALILMVPLLTLYANVMGILGGMVVAVSLIDISIAQYIHQTADALELGDVWAGLIKAGTYGVLIAIAGCMRGMQCGGSAQAVGEATTSAVVTSIVFMVVSAAVLAVVYNEIGL